MFVGDDEAAVVDVGTTKADEIRQQIEELIVVGNLPAGQVLRQDDLARRFGVSRTPIREALRQLAAIGLISFVPNRGVRVRTLDRGDWAQTYLARAALEGITAEAATSQMNPAQLDEMEAADNEFLAQVALLRQSGLSKDARGAASYEWVAANDRFHTVIIRSAAMPLLEQMIGNLRRVFSGESTWAEGSAADALYEASIRQHAAIRAAVLARNGPAARTLMEDHIRDSWRLLRAVLDETRSEDC